LSINKIRENEVMLKKYVGFAAVVALASLPVLVMAQEATPEMMEEMLIELPAVDPLSVSGDIIIAGSSTVFPLTEAVADLFREEGFAGEITIDSIGTGGGFERFCVAGETDIANASRPIRDSEMESCAALATPRMPIEFRVGTDALAVVVSAENDFLEEITLIDLARVFSGEATMWSEINESYPAEAIQLFSPGSDSGTFDYFVEAVLENEDAGNLGEESEGALLNSGAQFSEDDNVLVQGVEGSPFAIGYFGFAYYLENSEGLNVVAIDAGDGAIIPDAESAEGGTYPLSRPLFIYSDAGVMADKPQVAAFINFYLTNVDAVIEDVGYFPASVEAENVARQNLLDAMMMGM
jgi:phosphate transport system substrate-binding protein